jgi:hypothetical protein
MNQFLNISLKLTALLSVSLTLFTTETYAADVAGKILLIKGDVFILDSKANVVADPQGKRGRKTAVGSEFFVGETLSTKAGARVKLQFIEGANEVVLGSDTTMLIERAGNGVNKKGTTLNLSKGEVRSDVKVKYSGQGADVYEVKSKNAVAGVRGTVFTAMYNPKSSKFTVATERGAVSVSAVGKGLLGAQLVTAGKYSTTSGETVAPPAAIASNPELAQQVETLGGGSSNEKSSSSESGGSNSSEKNDKQEGNASKDDSASAKSEKSSEVAASSDDKQDSKSESKQESRQEGKAESKSESKSEAKNERTADNKSETKAESRSDSKSESRSPASSGSAPNSGGDGAPSANQKAEGPPLGREMVAPASGSSTGGGRNPASAAPTGGPILGGASGNSFKPGMTIPGVPSNLGTILDSAKNASTQNNQQNRDKGTVKVKIE